MCEEHSQSYYGFNLITQSVDTLSGQCYVGVKFCFGNSMYFLFPPFFLSRNDTKEDVFVHQVEINRSLIYLYATCKKDALYIYIRYFSMVVFLVLDCHKEKQPKEIPPQCWRWRNCGV